MPLSYRYLLYTVALLLSIWVPNQSIAKQVPVNVQLKWYHQFQFAGYYAAQKHGFYKQENLAVTIYEGNPHRLPIETVLSGGADFGVTGPDILTAFLQNKPVVVTAVIFQHSADVFLSLTKSHIRTPSDLVGKKIMTSNDHGFHILRSVFLKEGIPLDSIHFLKHSWKTDDLINGNTDAITAYITAEPQQLRAKGYQCNLIRPIDYGIDFYGDLIFTTRKKLRNDPQQAEAFNRASIRGWEYAMSHQEEIANYILTLPGVKERGITKAFLLEEAREMQSLILPDLIEIGHMNPGRWQSMLSVYKDLGVAKKNASINGLLYQPKYDRENFYAMLIYFIAIALSITMGVIIWSWQLRKQVSLKTAAWKHENTHRFEAEQKLELATEAAGLGMWQWDVPKAELSFNERWASMLGYTLETVPKNTQEWFLIVHPDDKARMEAAAGDLISNVVDSNIATYRLKTKSGKWKWVMSFRKVVSRDANNTAERISGIHLDVDSIKNREIELNEVTKELVKKNKELEKFAYITSHNLRAPVVNLKSLTDIYAEGDLDENTAKDIFSKIKQSVNRLDSTLNDLIEIVSSKGGEIINLETISFATELKNVIGTIEKQVQESGASIKFEFAEAETVKFSKRYFHSIVLNLLTNAIKYRSFKRQLHIYIKTYPINDFICMEFQDNGIGIDIEKFRNKIFGLYQRFNIDREGKGLGLYIIKSQIEAMDGKIQVESKLDEGSTFKVFFYTPKIV